VFAAHGQPMPLETSCNRRIWDSGSYQRQVSSKLDI
jgi:hypothetical protein